jgi:septum formation protein
MENMLQRPTLILASTSPYRRELLLRLGVPFVVVSPHTDETPLPLETPSALAQRLALAKAHAVSQMHPHAVVIGSDQVADLDGQTLGKPGTVERATQQLRHLSGRHAVFQTAVAVVHADTGFAQVKLASVDVTFRTLNEAEIQNYLKKEPALDCAGSAKCEGLGIALLDRIHSDDPTALIGLPLIRTCQLLRQVGINPLDRP